MQKTSYTTQSFVPIEEVRDGVIVLKDGSLRMILMASSLNFALKSGDEQMAIIAQFQQFLNSLEFSIEFYIQSRELDIRPYVVMLEERKKEQMNDLIKIQTTQYIQFIKDFTEASDIMTKNFFIVVPYARSVFRSAGGIKEVFSGGKKTSSAKEKIEAFEESQTQLLQRAGVVRQGLIRSGVRVVELGTEEIIELFYKIFNPGELEKPIVTN